MVKIEILDHFMGPGMQPPISPLLSTCEPTPAFWPVFGLYLAYIWPIGAQVGIYPAPRGRTGDLGYRGVQFSSKSGQLNSRNVQIVAGPIPGMAGPGP